MRSFSPVDPDAETARRWAEEELAKSPYQDGGDGLDEIASNWLQRLFDNIDSAVSQNPVIAVLLVALVAGAVAAGILFGGPLRRGRAARRPHALFPADDRRTSSQLRAAAEAAAAAGDWGEAAVERFRAVVRSLEERQVLPELPGATAAEAGAAMTARFPDVSVVAARAVEAFDHSRYSLHPATRERYEAVVVLDDALAGRGALAGAGA